MTATRYGRQLPSKSRFLPTEPSPSYSDVTVTVYRPDGTTLTRTIPRETLHARDLAEEKHEKHMAASIAPRTEWNIPSVSRRKRSKGEQA